MSLTKPGIELSLSHPLSHPRSLALSIAAPSIAPLMDHGRQAAIVASSCWALSFKPQGAVRPAVPSY